MTAVAAPPTVSPQPSGILESALHFRLTDRGRAELPADYQPPIRVGSGIPWATPS
jgi:hypothetical protein